MTQTTLTGLQRGGVTGRRSFWPRRHFEVLAVGDVGCGPPRTADPLIVLDDSDYYVGVTTPAGGYECIGSLGREPSGRWHASIFVPFDARTDSDSKTPGSFVGVDSFSVQ